MLPSTKFLSEQHACIVYCLLELELLYSLATSCKVTWGKWEVGVNRRNGKICTSTTDWPNSVTSSTYNDAMQCANQL